MEKETFGQWLKRQRQGEGLTLRKFAPYLGIKFPYLSQIENDNATASEELAQKIAVFFGVDIEKTIVHARGIDRQIAELKEKYPNSLKNV